MSDQITPALKIFKNQPVANSVEVAKFFGKRHDHVIRDIRKIMSNCPESFNAPNFGAVNYKDSKGELREAYYLAYDGLMLLAMGYTGPKAFKIKLAYMAAFNAMKAELMARAIPAPKAKALPKPRRKASPVIPAHDSIEAKIETILNKVRFYRREVSDAEKQASALLTAERAKSRPGNFEPGQDPVDQLYLSVACANSVLWSALDFNLRAIEDGIQARLAVIRA